MSCFVAVYRYTIFFAFFFFFQAEDGIRDLTVTGIQTCALRSRDDCPGGRAHRVEPLRSLRSFGADEEEAIACRVEGGDAGGHADRDGRRADDGGRAAGDEIGRASCRERV